MKTNYELVEYFEAFHSKDINSIFHSKGENIITASEDSTIKVWNKERKYSTLIGHEDSVNVVDKKYIVKWRLRLFDYSLGIFRY
jgi:WD40 repeat protein